MQQDKNVNYRKRDDSALGDFGEESPTNSFSGGETDHLFISHHGEQFYDVDLLSGLAAPGDGRTFCMLDYDRDGWIDFVTASANAPTIQLFRNRLGETHRRDLANAGMVALRFVGGNKTAQPSTEWSNRNGIGAEIAVFAEGPALLRELRCSEGRSAENSQTLIVGVGDAPIVHKIEVRWPSGKSQTIENVALGHVVTFYENPSDAPSGQSATSEPYLLRVLDDQLVAETGGDMLPLSLPVGDGSPRLNLVTAMSTTCATCKAKQPQVKVLRDTFPNGEIGIWAVGTDLSEDAAKLSAYETEHEVYYDVLPDLPMAERQSVRDYVRKLYTDDLTPVTVITDPTGKVLKTITGIPSVSDIRQLLGS